MSLKLGTSIGFAVSSTSASGTITPNSTLIRVSANVSCAFRTGVGAQTAVLTDTWVGAGESVLVHIPATHTVIAAITEGAATGRLSCTVVSDEEE